MADDVNTQGNTELEGQTSDSTAVEQDQTTESTDTASNGAVEANVSESSTDKDAGLLGNTEAEQEPSVPDKYEFSLPDGVELNDDELGWLSETAKKHELTQAEADKAVAFAMDAVKDVYADIEKQQAEAFEKFKADNRAEWEKATDHAEKQLKAEAALKKRELYDYFIDRGYAHDAKLLAAFADLGRYDTESTSLRGGESGNAEKSAAEVLWPYMSKK